MKPIQIMRFSLTVLCLLIFVSFTNAQDSNFTDGELRQMSESLSSDNMFSFQSRDVKGDPYLNPEFTRGKIQVNKNVETGEKLLRFNTEQNILEFKEGSGFYGIDPHKIDGFVLMGEPNNLVFKNGFKSDDHDINKSTLLRVLYEGDTKLMAHHTTSLKENLASYGSAQQKDEYVDNVKYYIMDASGNFTEIKLKKGDVMDALDNSMEDQLEKYADSNNLSFEDENDLVTILTRYDSLRGK